MVDHITFEFFLISCTVGGNLFKRIPHLHQKRFSIIIMNHKAREERDILTCLDRDSCIVQVVLESLFGLHCARFQSLYPLLKKLDQMGVDNLVVLLKLGVENLVLLYNLIAVGSDCLDLRIVHPVQQCQCREEVEGLIA